MQGVVMPACFSESRVSVECSPRGFWEPPGGIQPARVLGATSGIGLYDPSGYSKKPLPKRSARQGLTQLADATLVPKQARREQVLGILDLPRTEVGGVCVRVVRRAANRGLSVKEGVLARASAMRPRATFRTLKGHRHNGHEKTTHTLRCVLRNRTLSLIHSHIHTFTCRHKATAPQATHVHVTAYVSCRAACAVVRVCTVRSLRVCACGVWAHFFAQGEMTRNVNVQRSASTAPVPKRTPSALLGPHSPRARTRASCCRPPPVPGRGFAEIPICLCSAAGPTYSQFP